MTIIEIEQERVIAEGVITLVGWCAGDGIYDHPYRGRGHKCPFADTWGGYEHGMFKRRAWICRRCGWCHLIGRRNRPSWHVCDYDGLKVGPFDFEEAA